MAKKYAFWILVWAVVLVPAWELSGMWTDYMIAWMESPAAAESYERIVEEKLDLGHGILSAHNDAAGTPIMGWLLGLCVTFFGPIALGVFIASIIARRLFGEPQYYHTVSS